MHRTIRIAAARTLVLKTAAHYAPSRFVAWIDRGELGTRSVVMPRVRNALVLRLVAGRRATVGRPLYHAAVAR